MARILLGVCGGIAAYKALELTRLAMKAGPRRARHPDRGGRALRRRRLLRRHHRRARARHGMGARSAARRVPRAIRRPAHAPLSHLELVDRADVFLVAPASANTIAKLAAGQADNLLCAAALACRRPLLVAPAMNDAMYEHPATRANLETLRARGAIVLEPGTGALGSPGRVGDRPAARAARPAGGRGVARSAPRAAGTSTACPCWSRRAARASRSTRCASSATAPRGGWASRSPRRPRAAAPASR